MKQAEADSENTTYFEVFEGAERERINALRSCSALYLVKYKRPDVRRPGDTNKAIERGIYKYVIKRTCMELQKKIVWYKFMYTKNRGTTYPWRQALRQNKKRVSVAPNTKAKKRHLAPRKAHTCTYETSLHMKADTDLSPSYNIHFIPVEFAYNSRLNADHLVVLFVAEVAQALRHKDTKVKHTQVVEPANTRRGATTLCTYAQDTNRTPVGTK